MTGEQVYVAHAPGDLELVQDLFSTVKNFPFGVHIALEEADADRSRDLLKGRIDDSDLLVAVLTDDAADDQWVNQEIGYAVAKDVPVLPLYDHEQLRGGYVTAVDGIEIDRENLTATIFALLGRLRDELTPLGGLAVPNWFVRFPCTLSGCGHRVTLEIDDEQTKLWKRHKHGQRLETTCDVCGTTYYFDPATIGFVRREDGRAPPGR
ncbi:TIR domain-containing protein [Natribaculum luteum]|uniref:TIR domain-containing protein n=1 Tax=Natribaculum luteum TaxID=1586232 RepID=A0ABD5NXZ2_9EURY|nr:toll/interleukin-1 receptor domain-containing protein [Natribaculum luteum]